MLAACTFHWVYVLVTLVHIIIHQYTAVCIVCICWHQQQPVHMACSGEETMIEDDSGNDDIVHSQHLVITLLLNEASNKQQQMRY